MPYIVTLRTTERTEIQIPEQAGLDTFNSAVLAAVPDGHDLVAADLKRSIATVRRRDTREVTIADRAELDTCVPDGWQALSIRDAT